MPAKSRSWTPGYASSRLTRRRLLEASAAGAGALALIACGGGSSSVGLKLDDAATSREPGSVWSAKNDWRLADETKQAVKGGIYRGVMETGQAGHYDAITLAASQVPFSQHVHEMLLLRNRQPGVQPGSREAGTPVGGLAEGWEFSADGMTVTFTMRQGVKWHPVAPVNGRVMDLDDWKTSQERHLAAGMFRADMMDVLDKFEFPDARHMVWKLKTPYGPLFERIYSDRFAFPIQPKELNANPALAESTAVGTGYKVLDKNQPSITMEYRRHEEYWGGVPFINRWHAPIIPEYANRYAQFVRGNIQDFAPTARDVLLLHRDAPQTVVVAQPVPEDYATRYRFGVVSPDAQPTADPRVRIAIRRSVDFRKIGEFLSNKAEFDSAGVPIEISPMTHVPQNPTYWLNPEKGELGKASDNFLFSVAEAKKLTAAAGFNGPVPLFFPVRLNQGQFTDADQLVIDGFAQAGTFALDILRVASAPEYRKYQVDREMDGLHGTEQGSTNDVDYFIMRDYHSKGRADGRQAYAHAKIDEFAAAQRKELDVERRAAVLKEFQVFMAEWMPAIPGQHLFTTFMFRWPWLHNANWGEFTSPPGGRPAFGGHLHWLDSAMPNRETGAT